jgi:hypothetical protein
MRTIIPFPKIHKSPVEPNFAFLFLALRARLQVLWGGERVGEHDGIGPDGLEAVVFAQARHASDERLDAEAVEDWVDCGSAMWLEATDECES